jgi:aminoglycoside/choline kinase family phosphotransferase
MDRASSDPHHVRERVANWLERSGLALPHVTVVPLTGDASTRRYFRVIRPDAGSVVLAVYDAAFAYDALPFVNVTRLLAEVPLPIPAILGHAGDLGVLVLEDLGDVTLQAHLGVAPPIEHDALYRQAVALIERLQRRGRELTSPAYLPYGIAFDRDKLTWELDFFVKYFMEAYRGVEVSPAVRAALGEEWAQITEELAGEACVVCHRDYHSRNLMVHEGQLYLIDFQDARMGPDTYDLASLLRDSYVDLSDESVTDLTACFLTLKGSSQPPARRGRCEPDHAEFRRRFDAMALQRNLKALGTFGYQTATRRNPVYIQYMPRTLRNARTNLEKYPRFARLLEILAGHIEELR